GSEFNVMTPVRRHVSRSRGCGSAKALLPPLLTLAFPDGPGDDPATIGSGPTVPDATTLADARAILERRRASLQALGLGLPRGVEVALTDPANETPKPGDPAFKSSEYRIIATPAAALAAAGPVAKPNGYAL